MLGVLSHGYLVPRHDNLAGQVHSVFAHACNLACDAPAGVGLLTLCTSALPDAPTALRLAQGVGDADLRTLFRVGDPVSGSGDTWRVGTVQLDLRAASRWQPTPCATHLAAEQLHANWRRAARLLAQQQQQQHPPSVLHADAVPVVAALTQACRELDFDAAASHAGRLIGWGEGLTPSGDDFLVGLLAVLGALAQDETRRSAFCAALAAHIAAQVQRTTPIAAHYLRLAAGGHFGEPLLTLRDALLTQADGSRVDAALQHALAIGATSGADTVAGLVAGLSAWLAPASGRTIAG
jgi:Protein of unknown function (DUF2877)